MSSPYSTFEYLTCGNPNESDMQSLLMAIPRTLFGLSRSENILIYTWVFILVLYLVFYFLIPLCYLNSTNGLLDSQKVLISTLLIFVGLVFVLIIFYKSSSCESVMQKQNVMTSFLNQHRVKAFDSPYKVPKFLSNTITREANGTFQ